MNKIEKAKELFFQLESKKKIGSDIALRRFEIQSRLANCRKF